MRGSWRPNRTAAYWPPTLMAISVSFPFSLAAQPGAWGPTSLGASFLYRILSPTGLMSKLTDFLSSPSYIIVQRPSSCGCHNRTHSTRPRSRLYSDIPWADAPVIYIGAFPILTARPGRRSIYNKSANTLERGMNPSLPLFPAGFFNIGKETRLEERKI